MKSFILTISLIIVLSLSSFASFASFTKSWNGQLWTIKDNKGTVVIVMEQDLLPNKAEDITLEDLKSLKTKRSTWYCVNNFCF